MDGEHTISGLMRKRQDMSNQIEATQNTLRPPPAEASSLQGRE